MGEIYLSFGIRDHFLFSLLSEWSIAGIYVVSWIIGDSNMTKIYSHFISAISDFCKSQIPASNEFKNL